MMRRWFTIRAVAVFALLAGGAVRGADLHATLTASAGGLSNGSGTIDLHLSIALGFHAQSHTPLDSNLIPLVVTMDPARHVSFDAPAYPKPTIEIYPALGSVSVYTGAIDIVVPFHVMGNAPASLNGVLRFQACNSNACFPPRKLPFAVTLNNSATTIPADAHTPAATRAATNPSATALAVTTTPASEPAITADTEATPPITQSQQPGEIFGHDLTHDAYWLAFAGAFVVGIIFNIMPCVLPVVPLKIMGFYEVSRHDRRKSLLLGAVFSAGLIASFAVLGILIAALHVIDWGGLFRESWFTAAIVLVLVVMSFSLFGLFTVGLPSGIYQFTPRHDTYGGNFLFGILTAALSTPCTFGMFVGLLTWALSQPATIGVALIMTVGVGMAFPYLVLSAFPQLARNFPRTGQWADVVKQMMGFLLLATAVYFAQPLLARFFSTDVFWWAMFGVIAIGSAFLIVRTIQISRHALPRIIATAIALLATAASLSGAVYLTARPYQWHPYSAAAVAAARGSGRPVLIDFTATWCANCHYLEAFVLNDRRVVRAVKGENVAMFKADVTDENAPAASLLRRLNPADSIPVTAVYLPHATQPKTLINLYRVDDVLEALNTK